MARELVKNIADNRRNILINGNFDIWQRGTSFLSAGSNVYTADRWKNQLAGADISRQVISADLPESQYGIRYVASSEQILLEQRIESGRTRNLVGKQITLNFKARATSGTPSLVLDVSNADSIDTWSSSTSVFAGQALGTLSESFQDFAYTFTVTQTMASNGFNIVIKTPATVTATVDFAQVQLLEGGTGSFRLAANDIAREFALCQRYYESSVASRSLEWWGNITSGRTYRQPLRFVVQKRVTATITIEQITKDGTFNDPTVSDQGPDGFRLNAVANNNDNGVRFGISWNADAEL